MAPDNTLAATLTDTERDIHLDAFESEHGGIRVRKRTLRGGRRDGVDLIEVDNGALTFSILPTRGMGIWKATHKATGTPIGWRSPVTDGPIHPAHVNLMNDGGLGWLAGFDELLVRCGLENNGAPYEVKTRKPDGTESNTTYPLHGKIANIPAHRVAVLRGEDGSVAIEGHVVETRLFFLQARMITRIRTEPGSNRIVVEDTFVNLKNTPATYQVLYHWNFGPPLLGPGARLVAPVEEVCPRDARAAEGIGHLDVYLGPEPGFAEQVYFFKLFGAEGDGATLAVLRDPKGEKGVAVRFKNTELPCFTLWKATGGLDEGYVTGLEPATNFPNPRSFEEPRGRVETLAPGASRVATTILEVLPDAAAVAAAEAEVAAIRGSRAPRIHKGPVEPFAPV